MPNLPQNENAPRPESVQKLIEYLGTRSIVTKKIDSQHIHLARVSKADLLVHMSDIYIFSESDLEEALILNSKINAVVVMSSWNSYTRDAKESAKKRGIGLFTFKEFLGAVYYDGKKFLNYTPPERD